MKAPTIDDACCFIDIIDECVKEFEKETPLDTKVLKILAPPILEDDEWREPYVDDNLRECLALTHDLHACLKITIDSQHIPWPR